MVAMAPPAPSVPARTQRYLGRYELIGELARGGMGTVYLARHAGEAGFQRLFAIKVMHPHLADETEFVDMLRDEARIAARIHHPNVVSIVDIGAQDDLHYVVMDYVEGPPFGTLIKRSGSEDVLEKVLNVVIDTLEGIHAAHTVTDDEGHELNLVHRDVSPQNILVGADGVARITDFGIAKAETRIVSTRPGTRKGKLAFMAPEQITNDEVIDRRADIWAAGVVLWTGLTGKNLFRGESDAATIHNVLSKDIPPPSRVGRKPPTFLDDAVMRALERDTSKRYMSAMEMADALRTVGAQNGLKSSRQQVAKWVGDLFGEELGLRRKAIRSVARRREEQQELTESSQITVLPALPGVSGTLNSGALTGTGSISGFSSVDTPSRGNAAPQVAATAVTAPTNPQSAFLTSSVTDAGQSKRSPAIFGALVGLGIGTVAIAAFLGSRISTPAVPPPAVALPAVQAPVAAAAAPQKAPEPVAKAAAPAAEAPATGKSDSAAAEQKGSADEKDDKVSDGKTETHKFSALRYAARRNYGRATAKPAPAVVEQPAPEPKSEPKEEPRAKAPTAVSTPGFEKNPYMRR